MRHVLRTRPRWSGQLRRNLTARAIAGSNTIEGYAATVDDVEALMAGEEPLETAESTRVELEGHQRSMTYIQGLADTGVDFRYDAGLLNGLHFMMQGHHLGKRPGRWRDGPVYVTSADDPLVPAYTAPDAERVPALANELIDWLNEGTLLESGAEHAPVDSLLPPGPHRQAQQAQRRTDLLSRAWSHLAEQAEAAGLDERVVHALLPAFRGAKVRRTVYQRDADISDQQTIRDIRELVRLGRLVPHGRARARHYGPGPRMAPVQEAIRQSVDPYTDPYRRVGREFSATEALSLGTHGVFDMQARKCGGFVAFESAGYSWRATGVRRK